MFNQQHLQSLLRQLLSAVGEDPTREGLVDTPRRAAESMAKLVEGYDRNLANEVTTFPNTHRYDDVVLAHGIEFFSTCEHHLLPFWGHAAIAYIPGEQILGLSKMARAVDIFSRRLQEQERLTVQIADAIASVISPRGIAVHIRATHMCNMIRGVEKKHSGLVTHAFRGVFREQHQMQQQFLSSVHQSDPQRSPW